MNTYRRFITVSAITCAVITLVACNKTTENYDANGVFETTEVVVSSETSGRILQLDLEEGSTINAYQVVGQIDSTQLLLKKKQLEASLKGLRNRRPDLGKQIAALEQQLTTARTERKRVQNLVKAEAATSKQLDDVDAQIAVFEKQLAASRSTLETTLNGLSGDEEALTLQIDQLDDQLAKCHLSSPIRGTVLAKYAQAGELTTAGKPLFKVGDVDNLILRAYITSDQLTQLKLGQQVTVHVDHGKKTATYKGSITWISSTAEFTPKTIQTRDERANLVYAMKVAVKNDGFLKIGMYGGVTQ
jgi:HlyD family secretion protein